MSRLSLLPVFTVFLTTSAFLHADSHPSWWTYASPEATALVGIQWDSLRHSIVADGVASEIAPGGDLRFPDLACLRDARQIIVSSPALLAMVTGSFPIAKVREQAERIGFKPSTYKSVSVWYPGDKETLGVAFLSDNLLLLGSRRTLEGALDRSASEGGAKHYSPLLARASRFAQNADLWVVAAQLPDPLASLFLPMDVDARAFDGLISMRNGMFVSAVIDTESERSAAELAKQLRASAGSLPSVFHSMKIEPEKSSVTVSLEVNREQLASHLYGAKPAPAVVAKPAPVAPPVATVALAPPPPPVSAPAPAAPKPEPPKPDSAKPVAAEPEAPQIVRILGLDEGPREIVLPPVKKQQ